MELILPESLNRATVAELLDAVVQAAEPIVLRGDCRGLDLQDVDAAAAMLPQLDQLLDTLLHGPQPLLALVEGPVFGGSVGLISVADVVVATPGARLGLPECLLGLTPATVLPYIERRIGPVRARRLALSGQSLSAEEAKQMGLVDVVSPFVEEEARRQLKRWARADPASIAAIRAVPLDPPWTTTQWLLRREETRRRIAAFDNGEAPWT